MELTVKTEVQISQSERPQVARESAHWDSALTTQSDRYAMDKSIDMCLPEYLGDANMLSSTTPGSEPPIDVSTSFYLSESREDLHGFPVVPEHAKTGRTHNRTRSSSSNSFSMTATYFFPTTDK